MKERSSFTDRADVVVVTGLLMLAPLFMGAYRLARRMFE
jgi:hypothetical protein